MIVNSKFSTLWKYYVLQSLLAGIALLVLVLVLGKNEMVAVSAMGATAFIVFTMPRTESAKAKNVIGSHLVGLASGTIFCFTNMPYSLECSLAVAIAALLMLSFNVVHPPAAGTALAVAINQVPFEAFITVIVGTLVLSLCRYCLRDYLKNLI